MIQIENENRFIYWSPIETGFEDKKNWWVKYCKEQPEKHSFKGADLR